MSKLINTRGCSLEGYDPEVIRKIDECFTELLNNLKLLLTKFDELDQRSQIKP